MLCSPFITSAHAGSCHVFLLLSGQVVVDFQTEAQEVSHATDVGVQVSGGLSVGTSASGRCLLQLMHSTLAHQSCGCNQTKALNVLFSHVQVAAVVGHVTERVLAARAELA